jgi:hypothetical protein
MIHPVLELVLIDIEDGTHEGEIDLLLGLQHAVVLDPVVDIREVQGYPRAIVQSDGGLDVAEKAA